MKPVKLGIIGCGIATTELHWPALHKLQDQFEIAMVCNRSLEKAQAFSKTLGTVPYVTDYKALLKNDSIEAVTVAVPIHLNHEIVTEALDAGKHVFVEKPIAANREEAASLVDLAEKSDRVTIVAENLRYQSVYLKLKELIDQGAVGSIYSIFWNCFANVTEDNKYAQTPWRKNHQYPGGFITDGGVHNIAVIRDLLGEIKGKSAHIQSINPAIGEIDSMSYQFISEKGTHGILNLYFSSKGFDVNFFLLSGDKGSIVLQDDTITAKLEDGSIIFKQRFQDDDGYRKEFENFYSAIREGAPVKSTFAEGYRDLCGILEAIDLGK